MNQYLFDILVRGQAYGILHGVARPFSAVATVFVEYADEPALMMLIFSCVILVLIQLIVPKLKLTELNTIVIKFVIDKATIF